MNSTPADSNARLIDLASLLAPEPDQRLLVIPHNDPGMPLISSVHRNRHPDASGGRAEAVVGSTGRLLFRRVRQLPEQKNLQRPRPIRRRKSLPPFALTPPRRLASAMFCLAN
jgi:hypothetical protein